MIDQLRRIDCALSPENLYQDGERSRSKAMIEARKLNRMRQEVVEALGGEPSIQEIKSPYDELP